MCTSSSRELVVLVSLCCTTVVHSDIYQDNVKRGDAIKTLNEFKGQVYVLSHDDVVLTSVLTEVTAFFFPGKKDCPCQPPSTQMACAGQQNQTTNKLTCGTPLQLNPLEVESGSKHQWTNVLHEYPELLNEAEKSLGNI